MMVVLIDSDRASASHIRGPDCPTIHGAIRYLLNLRAAKEREFKEVIISELLGFDPPNNFYVATTSEKTITFKMFEKILKLIPDDEPREETKLALEHRWQEHERQTARDDGYYPAKADRIDADTQLRSALDDSVQKERIKPAIFLLDKKVRPAFKSDIFTEDMNYEVKRIIMLGDRAELQHRDAIETFRDNEVRIETIIDHAVETDVLDVVQLCDLITSGAALSRFSKGLIPECRTVHWGRKLGGLRDRIGSKNEFVRQLKYASPSSTDAIFDRERAEFIWSDMQWASSNLSLRGMPVSFKDVTEDFMSLNSIARLAHQHMLTVQVGVRSGNCGIDEMFKKTEDVVDFVKKNFERETTRTLVAGRTELVDFLRQALACLIRIRANLRLLSAIATENQERQRRLDMAHADLIVSKRILDLQRPRWLHGWGSLYSSAFIYHILRQNHRIAANFATAAVHVYKRTADFHRQSLFQGISVSMPEGDPATGRIMNDVLFT